MIEMKKQEKIEIRKGEETHLQPKIKFDEFMLNNIIWCK